MKNILISFFSGLGDKKIPCYYEGLMSSLSAQGNNVYYLITNSIVKKAWNGTNVSSNSKDDDYILSQINAAKLDLIITFNNSIPNIIHENFDIKTIIAEADSYRYYNDKEYLRIAGDRFLYTTAAHENIKEISKTFSVSKKNVHKIELATNLEPENLELKRQLLFLGSPFFISKNLKTQFANHLSYSEMVRAIHQSNEYWDLENYSNKAIRECFSGSISSTQEFIDNGSALYRRTILEKISPLGLEVFGAAWEKEHSPIIYKHFNKKSIVTAYDNQKLYNSSNITLNINHLQAGSAFSWRVLDIAATNSMLVSNYSSGIPEFFGNKVKIPMFETANEAYNLIKYSLNNTNYMRDIVLASQEVIMSKGRWEHRIKDFSEITGLNLLNTDYEPKLKNIAPDKIKVPERYIKKVSIFILKSFLSTSLLIFGKKFNYFFYTHLKFLFPNLAFTLNEIRKRNWD